MPPHSSTLSPDSSTLLLDNNLVSKISHLAFNSNGCSPSLSAALHCVTFPVLGSPQKGFKFVNSLRVRKSGSGILSVFSEFNRFIRFHCDRIPIGFASIGSKPNERNGALGDTGNEVFEDAALPTNGIDAETQKRVLILMSDTGGGHRASAEAIKAAFHLEFGDEYQVFVVDLWSEHTPWPFNQLPRSYNFLVKHGSLWKMTYYASSPRVVHQSNFAATSAFIARIELSVYLTMTTLSLEPRLSRRGNH